MEIKVLGINIQHVRQDDFFFNAITLAVFPLIQIMYV